LNFDATKTKNQRILSMLSAMHIYYVYNTKYLESLKIIGSEKEERKK
jgi:hypothetical protein